MHAICIEDFLNWNDCTLKEQSRQKWNIFKKSAKWYSVNSLLQYSKVIIYVKVHVINPKWVPLPTSNIHQWLPTCYFANYTQRSTEDRSQKHHSQRLNLCPCGSSEGSDFPLQHLALQGAFETEKSQYLSLHANRSELEQHSCCWRPTVSITCSYVFYECIFLLIQMYLAPQRFTIHAVLLPYLQPYTSPAELTPVQSQGKMYGDGGRIAQKRGEMG